MSYLYCKGDGIGCSRQHNFKTKFHIYRDGKAVSGVIFLLNGDPLAEVGVGGKHLVGVESLHDVDGAVHAHAQQPAGHEKNEDLQKQFMQKCV